MASGWGWSRSNIAIQRVKVRNGWAPISNRATWSCPAKAVRSASVLQVPGLFKSYKDLSAVRTAMDPEWRKSFDESGYQLLAFTVS